MNAIAAIAIALLSSTPDPNTTVARGLKWLAEKQNKDGTWESNGDFLKVNVTSYAGLALLMQGSTLQEGPYSANLRLAVGWFEKIAQPSGLLVPTDDPTEEGRYMQSHCAAILFLASAYDADGDNDHRKRLQKILDRAVAFAIEGQTPRGGWGFVSSREGGGNDETPSTVFMVQALLAASGAAHKSCNKFGSSVMLRIGPCGRHPHAWSKTPLADHLGSRSAHLGVRRP